MSRTNTRADAISRGAHEGEREIGLREWIAALPSGQHTEKIATFDTKIKSMRFHPDLPLKAPPRLRTGMATTRCPKRRASMSRKSTVRFWIGEIDRARAWARQLAASMTKAAS